MKLELKHLAGYLPYGLKLKINTPLGTFDRKFELDCGHDFNLHLLERNIKPILRPLSDLSKEIEVNGEKFLPIEEYKGRYLGDRLDECINASPSDLKYAQFHVIEKLLEWHFDVYGLIDAGLAIDINTLKK